ncbi:hypothetical protein TEA_001953 [Camellia sinensis var. sinensis]|uniref:Uncharacterized protein n=1 Tax=Camellia sinensis var. sinensis TaxID=542762 RepID=A0A4S4DUX2_CAMSN|nr:hypothetical protein TEA_001953 [Camellia sinensis var. sinensis]
MQAKDNEVKKLTTENAKLKRVVNVLEEQLAKREVHNVTQAFRGEDVNAEGVKYGLSGNEHVTDLTNNTTPDRVFAITGDAVSVWDVMLVREQTDRITEIQHGVLVGTEVVVISPNMAEGGRLNVVNNSFVQDVKCKVRKGLTPTGVECLSVRGRVSTSNMVHVCSIASNVDCNAKNGGCTDVIDVDDVDVYVKKSGFDINNKHGVWKMMTAAEKKKITDAYNRDGDRYAVMWDGHGHGVVMYFTDVKSLVRQFEIRGNVIDGYTVLLNAEHERINEGADAPDKSYFFSSICLDMMKNNNVRSRNRYIMDNLHAAKLFRYKNIVSEVQRQTMGKDSIDTQDQTTSNAHAYSYTHHQPPQPKYNRNLPFVRRLILALILLFVAITAVGWITWLILHPQEPVFHVDSLSVSNFNISDLQKNARYEVQLTVTNPNKKINLEFETFSVSVFYKRNPLSTGSVLRPFDVRKMNETAVKIELGSKPNENCQIRGKGTAIDMANMGRDWKQREMSLNVEMVGLAV